MLGRPIGHSLSPALHRAAYAALGLTGWTYDAIDCGADELPSLVAQAGPEWVGFSVTMPGKRAALDSADHVARTARLVGAANTLVRGADGSWTADNTDVEGIRRALTENGICDVDAAGAHDTVLGAGGTAQAAVVALAQMGADRIDVLVRDRSRTTRLRECAARAGVRLHIAQFDEPAVERVIGRRGLIISTLPAHAADFLADRPWTDRTLLLDAIYDPWPTGLARSIDAAGGRAIGGGEILLYQAAAQVCLMTGRRFAMDDPHAPPLDAMRAAIADRLG